jgi:hypothetical protein
MPDETEWGEFPRRGIPPPQGGCRRGRIRDAIGIVLAVPEQMDGSRQRARRGFIITLAFAAGASCATGAREPPAVATPATLDPRSCVVQIFAGTPPFEVEDLGPIQAPCPSTTRNWSSCGIDQPNLAQVACSSGADTVFGLYEVVGPKQGLFSTGARVMHARLGRRRLDVKRASDDGSAQ